MRTRNAVMQTVEKLRYAAYLALRGSVGSAISLIRWKEFVFVGSNTKVRTSSTKSTSSNRC